MWGACRGGMGGYSSWPDEGGVSAQAAWVIDAFGYLAGVDEELSKKGLPA